MLAATKLVAASVKMVSAPVELVAIPITAATRLFGFGKPVRRDGDTCEMDPIADSPFHFLNSPELLRLVVDGLDEDDALAFAMVCSPFREASCMQDGPFARFPSGVRTRKASMWSSAERLAWARGSGYVWDRDDFARAAAAGYLEAIAWASRHGCPKSPTTLSTTLSKCIEAYVARGGHVEMAKWAFSGFALVKIA